MKFLARINRNYLVLFTIVLCGITFAGYVILHIVIMRGVKENLLTREYLIVKQMGETGEIPNLRPVIEITRTNEEPGIKPAFKEVVIRNELESEDEIYLEYSNRVNINGTNYLIKLRQSVFENEDLILILASILFTLMASAFIISFFLTKRMNRTVWADFEGNLHEIENFDLMQNKSISLNHSDTEEFERLNKVVTGMTEKLQSDYRILKEFTENASHEIQTPLSIALLNLEEIMQLDLQEEAFHKVASTISALKRLSVLNQSLILLTKIENKQFTADKVVSFEEIISRKKEEFSSLFEAKALDLKVVIEHDLQVKMNELLADIMIGNLLSNAVNHNLKGGKIRILIKSGTFEICNTGGDNLFTNETIFNRFVSGNLKSYGLGLAIVKKICEIHHLEIQYFKDELHHFVIVPKS